MPTDWTYGTEGTAYPVKIGQVWTVAGHTFVCSDLREHSTLRDVLEGRTVDLLYSDPPWGQALLNGFRTKAGVDKADYRWEELYEDITQYGVERGVPVWLEASKPDSRDGMKVLSTMRKAGTVRKAWEVSYNQKNLPSGLFYTGTVDYPQELTDVLTGLTDKRTPYEVMSKTAPSGLVLDPCAGRGVTSRCAEEAGWTSVNNDLNANRVSASLVRMEKMTGETAERL